MKLNAHERDFMHYLVACWIAGEPFPPTMDGCTCAYCRVPANRAAWKRCLRRVMDEAERDWQEHGRDEANRILWP